MKKIKIFLLFSLGFFLSFCSSPKKSNDLTEMKIKGAVKSLTQTSFNGDLKFGEFQQKEIKVVHLYNSEGNKTELINYNPDESLNYKYIFKYDDKGNRIERYSYNSDGSLSFKEVTKYDYDQMGNWIKKSTFENDIPTEMVVREIIYY